MWMLLLFGSWLVCFAAGVWAAVTAVHAAALRLGWLRTCHICQEAARRDRVLRHILPGCRR
jgi:hypothetical protein